MKSQRLMVVASLVLAMGAGTNLVNASPKVTSYSFYIDHPTGSSEELRKITINEQNKVLSNRLVTSTDRNGLEILDSKKQSLLLSVGVPNRSLYLINSGGISTDLGIPLYNFDTGGGGLVEVKLQMDGLGVYGFDLADELSSVRFNSGNPTWTTLLTSAAFQAALIQAGGVAEDTVLHFQIVDPNTLILLTDSSHGGDESANFKIWKLTLPVGIAGSATVALLLSLHGPSWTHPSDLELSPSKREIAVLYYASKLAPNTSLKIITLSSGKVVTISPKRVGVAGMSFLNWLDEHNLISTSESWPTDPNGGRAVCRLNLKASAPCQYIKGVASYSMAGINS
jgi:hypothetical protein